MENEPSAPGEDKVKLTVLARLLVVVISTQPVAVALGSVEVSEPSYSEIPLRLSLAEIERLTTVLEVLESPELMLTDDRVGAVVS